MRTIVFRGRSTDGILSDARALWPDDKFVVVADRDDPLRQEGDMDPGVADGERIVANGGRTGPLVQLLDRLSAAEVVDLQRDGLTVLRTGNAPCDCGCGRPWAFRVASRDCC